MRSGWDVAADQWCVQTDDGFNVGFGPDQLAACTKLLSDIKENPVRNISQTHGDVICMISQDSLDSGVSIRFMDPERGDDLCYRDFIFSSTELKTFWEAYLSWNANETLQNIRLKRGKIS